MEVERKELEGTDIKVIIEKRQKEPHEMKSKQAPEMKCRHVQAAPKTKHKGTATCNIGIDVITQTPAHGIAEEIRRENQKRIRAEQQIIRERRLKEAKEAEKKIAEIWEKKRQENKDKSTDSKKKNKKKNKKKSNYLDKIVALDCEMVGVDEKGHISVLARACVLSGHGEVLIDQYCSSKKEVTDYRTHISGIEEKHMKNAQRFCELQDKIKNAIAGKIVVGHGLFHDFIVLKIHHRGSMIRDTAEYFIGKFEKNKRPGLKSLAKDQLGLEIQSGVHSPVIDAKAALDIYLKNREKWEATVPKRIPRPSEYDESDSDDNWRSVKNESDFYSTTDSEVHEDSEV